jgi:uncharacterized protein YndB with AHSA1/START domain
MSTDTLHKTSVTTPSATEIRIERTFDAPRELVWEAYTDPETLGQWLGPHGHSMTIESDLREGGSYRWLDHFDDQEMVFFGEFLEVREPEVIAATFAWEGSGYPPSIDRTEFIEVDGGRTKLVTLSKFESQELRDGMLQSGMERGVNDGYDKLDAILARMDAS